MALLTEQNVRGGIDSAGPPPAVTYQPSTNINGGEYTAIGDKAFGSSPIPTSECRA
ncbi:hypothetical protein SAMN04489743_2067 [Pseudarthrobacter equi]|uniref:Uncharacterized protein n=1 Tax=Pseudarthrobacter equi TaxID=728066 RepID=A0A1H1YLT9_9MICC|nr:hypothetical protein SAMN04489743_2067 [Pseudarthrobacter equi]